MLQNVKIFDITLERDQTLAQVARLQQRVEALMTCCRPDAAGTEGAAGAAAGCTVGRGPGGPPAGRAGSKRQPTPREQVGQICSQRYPTSAGIEA